LDDVPLAVSDNSPWTKPVAITFDDGYLDTYTHAFPILQKYRMTATIMLVSERIGGQNTWDCGRAESVSLLTLDQIREMERDGIRFGAHGAVHASLSDISIEDVRRELIGSKAKLEAILGHEISTLAYPFGRCSPEVCRIAEEAGFRAAFGVDQHPHTMLNFSRIDAARCGGTSLVWRLKTSGIYHRLRQSSRLRAVSKLLKRGLMRKTALRMGSSTQRLVPRGATRIAERQC
jgi:peptidoglycan/xylan/chitin deacetylase (PgdA/CDA1 family)